MKICFLTKIDKPTVNTAITFTKKLTYEIDIFYGTINDPFPSKAKTEKYDMLISYISPWIVPVSALDNTKRWNINFHPGPPEYPGIGCLNFAIFNSAKQFGATAHVMKPKVDTGKIIGVNRFEMTEEETVELLSIKTYSSQLVLYKEIMTYIVTNDSLPEINENWKRKPFKRSELEQLATINTNMNQEEIDKRIRATYYPGKPGPFIEHGGYRFEYNPDR
jgi:methionyl-tRNA formyltransferase